MMISTYSMWSVFRNCRKACELRVIHGLVPLGRDPNLSFGCVIHHGLQLWHDGQGIDRVRGHIDRAHPARFTDSQQKRDWHLARALMTGYAARYPLEEFDIVALEKTFEGPIINPRTGARSRSFVLAGKVDGIVRIGADHFILEHKTARTIDAAYIERLWTDFQVAIYARYAERALGIPITGIIYNILAKASLQQGAGETDSEFETRRANLISKSKSGKSAAQRRMPESDEDFQKRLEAKYADPEMFHRERLYLAPERFRVLEAELWELAQQFLSARRRGIFYQNTAFCFHYGRPCEYYPICRSNQNPNVITNLYRTVEPHEELRTPPLDTFNERPF